MEEKSVIDSKSTEENVTRRLTNQELMNYIKTHRISVPNGLTRDQIVSFIIKSHVLKSRMEMEFASQFSRQHTGSTDAVRFAQTQLSEQFRFTGAAPVQQASPSGRTSTLGQNLSIYDDPRNYLSDEEALEILLPR